MIEEIYCQIRVSPLFRFYAGERQGILSELSSIDYMPAWNGFFILTSTEDRSNRYHGNTLWFLSDEKISASRPVQLPPDKIKLGDLRLVEPQKIWLFGLDGKAEGVCVLSEEAASSGSQVRRARLALVMTTTHRRQAIRVHSSSSPCCAGRNST